MGLIYGPGENKQFYESSELCQALYSFKRTCETDAVGENSSFIFTVCVKSLPVYHYKVDDNLRKKLVNNP